MTRKKSANKDGPNKRFRQDIEQLFIESKESGAASGWDTMLQATEPKQQNRRLQRKDARKLKKLKKLAFSQKKPIPSQVDIDNNRREEKQTIKKKEKQKRKKANQKEKRAKQVKKTEKVEKEEKQIMDFASKRDDKEIKDLEKKLHLNKRKAKTLPQSFLDDGLDYILDVVSGENLEGLAEEMDEDDFAGNMSDSDDNEMDMLASDGEEGDSDYGNSEDSEGEGEEEEEEEESDQSDVQREEEEDRGHAKEKSSSKKTAAKMQQPEPVPATGSILKSRTKTGDQSANKSDQSKTVKHVKWSGVKTDQSEMQKVTSSDSSETKLSKKKRKRQLEEAEELDDDNDDEEEDDDAMFENSDTEHDNGGKKTNESINVKIAKKLKLSNSTGNVSNSAVLTEDIYGRLRDEQGNVVAAEKETTAQTGAYVPPGKRMMLADLDEKKKLELQRLKKQLKGLINRASEANVQPISSQIENLYMANSRADVNESLMELLFEACISPVLTPERLAMELMMLVAILHGNVGSEVGAVFLQHLVQKFSALTALPDYGAGKEIDNVIMMLAHLYNFKVAHSVLVFDVLTSLVDSFKEKDVELILLLLKHVGFTLRKEDPNGLRQMIVQIQAKASSEDAARLADQSRVRFMLEVILAIRNNNMRKIPNYDPEHLAHLKKLIRNYIKGGNFGDNQLHISLQDLLNAQEKGRWWLVGSAWEGQGPQREQRGKESVGMVAGVEVTGKLEELARKQRMNTEIRKNIFFIIMTSEDYIDAFEKLLRLGLKAQQQREITLVVLDCCLQEKKFNAFYAYLAQKLCEHDRKNQISLQFSLWDKFKEISQMSEMNRVNLGKLLTHLCASKAMSLSVFKVISFGTLEKAMVRMLKQVMVDLLTDYAEPIVEAAFRRIANLDKLHMLHEGLRLFLHHFVAGKKNKDNLLLKERVKMVDRIFLTGKSNPLL